MKTLLLMRHAKSSWSDAELQDMERPLNKRGEKDAPRMGKLIRDEKMCPDLILSSTAVRSAKTAQIVAEKCGYGGEIHFMDGLYMAEPPAYIAALKALPEACAAKMLDMYDIVRSAFASSFNFRNNSGCQQ